MDAVARGKAGEDISSVMASYRMARTSCCKWMARMAAGDGGVCSLRWPQGTRKSLPPDAGEWLAAGR